MFTSELLEDSIMDMATMLRDGSMERPSMIVCHPFCEKCGEICADSTHECMYCDTVPLCFDCWEACCP